MEEAIDATATTQVPALLEERPNLPPRVLNFLDEFDSFWNDLKLPRDTFTIYYDRNYMLYGRLVYDFLTHNSQGFSIDQRRAWMKTYQEGFPAVYERLRNEPMAKANIPDDPLHQYIGFVLNGYSSGTTGGEGRIYLNFDPSVHLAQYEAFVNLLIERRISCYIKTGDPQKINTDYFMQTDKVVLYFSHLDQQRIVTAMQDFYERGVNHFVDETPKLAVPLKGRDGLAMKGIAFSEEPDQEKTRKALNWPKPQDTFSFNAARAAMLLTYRAFQSWNFSNGDRATNFRIACNTFGPDYQNPAFNRSTKFDFMKENTV